jgi:hypothetical protein
MKLNRNQRQEKHEADDVISADHELAERLNHAAGRRRTLTAMQQDPAAAGQAQRETKQGQQEQQAGEHGKLHWLQNLNGHQHHEHGCGDAESEEQVQH